MMAPTKKGQQMDENLIYLTSEGTVEMYESGEDGDTYHAIALVENADCFFVWHYSKPFLYEEVKPVSVPRYGATEDDYWEAEYRSDERASYNPEDGNWEDWEHDARGARERFAELVKEVGRLRPMEPSEVRELIENEIRYKGQRYSAWEPNY